MMKKEYVQFTKMIKHKNEYYKKWYFNNKQKGDYQYLRNMYKQSIYK